MINHSRHLMFILLLSCATVYHAYASAIPEQLQQIENFQARADSMAFGNVGMDNYHLAKARAWLDLALGEYHENESTGLVAGAIEQAKILLDALENKQSNIFMDTPMNMPDTETVRPDLWDKIAKMKKHDKFTCSQRPIAEAEVHLVWAGHEKLESSWEYAQSYVKSAEELISEAQAALDDCTPKFIAEKVTISSDNVFGFGNASLEPSGLWRLNRLADKIRTLNSLEQVILIGHTDRLRSDGHPERNQLLSEQRAESVKQYLVNKGVSEDKIQASGEGSSQPLVDCDATQSKAKQVECLTPNRRVEIILRGANKILEPDQHTNPTPTTRN